MQVTFIRTAARRYAIHVQRVDAPDALMAPAPGYDSDLPHDVLHMVVEAILGLRRGIFGQPAAGGLAGTFRIVAAPGVIGRTATRQRRQADLRDAAQRKGGRGDAAQSERAAYLCWQEWLSRSTSKAHRAEAAKMAQTAKQIRDGAPSEELAALSPQVLDGICTRLDRVHECWSTLPVGGSIRLTWPTLAIVAETPSSPGDHPESANLRAT